MKKIVKIISVFLAVVIALSLTGCSKRDTGSDKLKLVCTVFPIYDWTRQIAGDKADIEWLLKNGTDMHSYDATVKDMVKIAECDAIIYIGGESDGWLNKALSLYDNKNRTELKLLGAKGSTALSEKDGHADHEGHHHKIDAYDEHIWLSLKNAAIYIDEICSLLCKKDGINSEFYKSNAEGYKLKLSELDKKYTEAVENARLETLIVADRFPFRYLTEDYELKHCAAFPGCSAETEASFETIAELSDAANKSEVKYILKTETADTKLGKTVIASTERKNIKLLTLDSMQSVTVKAEKQGANYLEIAEKNLKTLKKALE